MEPRNYWRGGLCVEVSSAPGSLIIFGASGDLAKRKLFPALYSLHQRSLLHETSRIIGIGRTQYTSESFREWLRPAFAGESTRFLEHVEYLAGDYGSAELYQSLDRILEEYEQRSGFPSQRTYYLALPTTLYQTVIENLSGAGMLSASDQEQSWRHLVLEKPFGRDFDSARELDLWLHKYLREEQIYRIDHYLGKDTVQNILMLRFANRIFEPLWNANYIDHVQVTAEESIGVGNRAGYFDSFGLLRDMFQNHLLEMLSLVAIEPPVSFAADAVRDEKRKLIESIRPFELSRLGAEVVRGQYEGYRSEPGVAGDSSTETYTAMRLQIDNWRWKGVPFYLRAGKKLAAKRTEIAIVFKPVPHSIFAPLTTEMLGQNMLVLKIQPDEGMELVIQAKQPGPKLCMGELGLNFRYADLPGGCCFEAYERLLLDAMLGDQTLFIRSDIIAASWRLFTPVLQNWEQYCELHPYQPGSNGPAAAAKLLQADKRAWRA
ncbi:MAG: glucose-6-phosphate dehydrogenase [Lentisphaerae bacterium]|jgi:glucose-6-phosphate 1-dehydrogenase|nr:glucose-6-phosphate dehydrogenase [Lentisphaerota bacterium]